MIDWSKLPDVVAIALLTTAFASVAQRNQTQVSRIWLVAWICIVLHFLAQIFIELIAPWNGLSSFLSIASLAWAGMLFRYAAVPFRRSRSSRIIETGLLLLISAFIALHVIAPVLSGAMIPVAILLGLFPLSMVCIDVQNIRHPQRWILAVQFILLSILLVSMRLYPADLSDVEVRTVLCTIYLGCCGHFYMAYRNNSAGSFVTISGFFAWSISFFVAPAMQTHFPWIHMENAIWNLPKYVVAVGMILLLLEKQIEHNKYLALHDDLTGLPNRRLFNDRLSTAVERARRQNNEIALLVVDLNRFKQVNDSFGHYTGDLLLRHVARIFAARVRRSDTVARTGGDEFSIILNSPAGKNEAAHVGSSLLKLLEEPIQIGRHAIHIGAAIGIAIFPSDAKDRESLLIAADLRMYEDKHGGSIPE